LRVHFVGFHASHGGRWRSIWPAAAMKAAGWDATAGEAWPDSRVDDLDVIVVHRPIKPGDLTMLRRRQLMGTKVIVQVDDLYHLIPKWNLSGEGYTEPRLATLDECMAEADGLITATATLADFYRPPLCRRVAVLRNLIPAAIARSVGGSRPNDPAVRIGWAGAVSVHGGDLKWLREHAGRMLRGARFTCVGDRQAPRVIGAPHSDAHPWIADPSGLSLYRKMNWADIGIVPLSDDPFNRFKSFIKALEFMLLGKPVVVRDLPEQRLLVRDGVDGFLVDTPADMADRVQMLVHDADLRDTMGREAVARAKEWTLEARGGQWAEALGDIDGEIWTGTEAAKAEAAARKSRASTRSQRSRAATRRPAKARVVRDLPEAEGSPAPVRRPAARR
jgi:hypothetical protein